MKIYKPSMWCDKCEEWTKNYEPNGNHTCGNEVKTSSPTSGFPDRDYEGKSTKQ